MVRWAKRYPAALRNYLGQGPRSSLRPALGLGRQAAALGLEPLDVARIHEQALKALGTIARKGGETGGLAVEYLCSALGSANPKLAHCAQEELAVLTDPELIDCLIRAMDNPTLKEPVREVLHRINTPEARAALGKSRQVH